MSQQQEIEKLIASQDGSRWEYISNTHRALVNRAGEIIADVRRHGPSGDDVWMFNGKRYFGLYAAQRAAEGK